MNNNPVFVLCSARSGSTLLRYILDTHPQVSCPPELHLATLIRQLVWVYANTSGLRRKEHDESASLEFALGETRLTVSRIMEAYLNRKQKKIWCEKSVSTMDCIDLVAAVFPNARYICLYRQCMDVVQSGIETLSNDPTGQAFGFAPYLAQSQDDRVGALIDYWHAMTARILHFEQMQSQNCYRIRYEDIVCGTDETLGGLFRFLGLDWDETLTNAIFSTDHDPGPGDGKIHSTREIHNRGLNRGGAIQRSTVSADRISKMNGLLQQLGYEVVFRVESG